MKWINAIGLILQFLSFWLAAPELLGEATLKRFEAGLRKFIALMPVIIITIIVLGYGLFFGITGILKGIKASKEGIADQEFYSFLIATIIATIFYFILMFRYKKILSWLDLKYAKPLTETLITNNQTRKNALIVGAIIFTTGFLMQLFVIVWD